MAKWSDSPDIVVTAMRRVCFGFNDVDTSGLLQFELYTWLLQFHSLFGWLKTLSLGTADAVGGLASSLNPISSCWRNLPALHVFTWALTPVPCDSGVTVSSREGELNWIGQQRLASAWHGSAVVIVAVEMVGGGNLLEGTWERFLSLLCYNKNGKRKQLSLHTIAPNFNVWVGQRIKPTRRGWENRRVGRTSSVGVVFAPYQVTPFSGHAVLAWNARWGEQTSLSAADRLLFLVTFCQRHWYGEMGIGEVGRYSHLSSWGRENRSWKEVTEEKLQSQSK